MRQPQQAPDDSRLINNTVLLKAASTEVAQGTYIQQSHTGLGPSRWTEFLFIRSFQGKAVKVLKVSVDLILCISSVCRFLPEELHWWEFREDLRSVNITSGEINIHIMYVPL